MRLTPSDPAATPCRRPRALLVGTEQTVTQLGQVLATSPEAPEAVGWVTLGGQGSEELGGRAVAAAKERGVELVLVSLPVAMTEPMRDITGALDGAGVAWRFMPTLADQL